MYEFIQQTNCKCQNLLHIIAKKMSVSTYELASKQSQLGSGSCTNDYFRILQTIERNCNRIYMHNLLFHTDYEVTPSYAILFSLDYAILNESFAVFKIFHVLHEKYLNKNLMGIIVMMSRIINSLDHVKSKETRKFITKNHLKLVKDSWKCEIKI